MKKRITLLLALLLTLGLLQPAALAVSRYEDREEDHSPIAYRDMSWRDYDDSRVEKAAEALSLACREENNKDAVQACYHDLLAALDETDTKYNLAEIAYYRDVTDQEAAMGALALDCAFRLDLDKVYLALADLMDSAYASVLVREIGTTAFSFQGYEGMTEEEAASYQRESEMVQEYGSSESRTYEELAELFILLLAEWKYQAEDYGYDSYRDYAYDGIYYREYAPEDVIEYREYVKAYMVPLAAELTELMLESDSYYELWQQQGPESQQILDFLERHMEDLAPELMPALRCMLDYGLYDLDRGANRADIGYTTNLYSYGVPFLFSLAYGDAEDYTNAIHEFGHFNQMYHHAGHYLYDYSDYDLSEVHSQGLELLFLEYAEDMVGEEYEEDFCRYTIWSMLDSVIEGCLYDEFLELAFEEENPSPDGLRELFQQVSVEYGYDGNDGEIWTEISHNFESPFYYISYSVSAMTALELYTESLKDREGAIETYLKLTALPADTGFLTAVKKVGMSNPLQENSIKEMADVLNRRYLQGEEQPEEATAVRKQDGGKGLLVISIGGLILIIGLLTLGALLQRRREQAAEAGLTEEKDNPV